jgi:hypothetical protein
MIGRETYCEELNDTNPVPSPLFLWGGIDDFVGCFGSHSWVKRL